MRKEDRSLLIGGSVPWLMLMIVMLIGIAMIKDYQQENRETARQKEIISLYGVESWEEYEQTVINELYETKELATKIKRGYEQGEYIMEDIRLTEKTYKFLKVSYELFWDTATQLDKIKLPNDLPKKLPEIKQET